MMREMHIFKLSKPRTYLRLIRILYPPLANGGSIPTIKKPITCIRLSEGVGIAKQTGAMRAERRTTYKYLTVSKLILKRAP